MIQTLLASGTLLDQLGINLKVLGTQIVIFVITFVILSRLLFGRALSFMQAREEEIRKSGEAIARDRVEVARLTKEYEVHLAKIDQEAYDKTQLVLKEALSQSAQTIAGAQAQAQEETEQALVRIAQEEKDVSVRLRAEVTRLCLAASEKALGMKLDPATYGPEVEKFISGRS
jgi:F0F1-type ATP synthase membrane subunit b/b'